MEHLASAHVDVLTVDEDGDTLGKCFSGCSNGAGYVTNPRQFGSENPNGGDH